MAHPNRSKKQQSPDRNPRPAEVIALREKLQVALDVGITEAQAAIAKLVHTTIRAWQQWETDAREDSHRRMHPAFWDLAQRRVDEQLEQLKAKG